MQTYALHYHTAHGGPSKVLRVQAELLLQHGTHVVLLTSTGRHVLFDDNSGRLADFSTLHDLFRYVHGSSIYPASLADALLGLRGLTQLTSA